MRPSSVVSDANMVQKENGDWVIPATQRPDGTWRKERVVRSGFISQAEIKKYDVRAARETRLRQPHTSTLPSKSASPPVQPTTIVTPTKPEGTAATPPVPPPTSNVVTRSGEEFDIRIRNKYDKNTKCDQTTQSSSSSPSSSPPPAAANYSNKINYSVTSTNAAVACDTAADSPSSPASEQLETSTTVTIDHRAYQEDSIPGDNYNALFAEKAVKTCNESDYTSIIQGMKSLSIATSTTTLKTTDQMKESQS